MCFYIVDIQYTQKEIQWLAITYNTSMSYRSLPQEKRLLFHSFILKKLHLELEIHYRLLVVSDKWLKTRSTYWLKPIS
jgi:hypothetical protein